MSLSSIFQAVTQQCTAELQNLDFGSARRPDLALPAMLFGPAGVASKGSAPSIAWKFGSERYTDGPKPRVARSAAGDQPRFLRTGWQSFEVHIWGVNNWVSPVRSQGSGIGALSFTAAAGAPLDRQATTQLTSLGGLNNFAVCFLQVVTGGAVGVATFRYSVDGGVTYSAPQLTGANIQLGTTGVFVTWTVQAGLGGTALQAGDLFNFTIMGAVINDYDTTEEMVNAFVSSLHAQMYGAYRLGTGTWAGQDGSEQTQQGKLYLLDIEVATPTTEVGGVVPARALVTNVDQLDTLGSTTTHP